MTTPLVILAIGWIGVLYFIGWRQQRAWDAHQIEQTRTHAAPLTSNAEDR